jgi:hypothetical protein
MPSWCECDLTITGRPEELQRFLDFAKGIVAGEETAMDFNKGGSTRYSQLEESESVLG